MPKGTTLEKLSFGDVLNVADEIIAKRDELKVDTVIKPLTFYTIIFLFKLKLFKLFLFILLFKLRLFKLFLFKLLTNGH